MINIQLDLGKPQPLLIETNTSNFKYPCDRDGNILFNEKEQMELFCSNGFAAPGVKANSIIVSCETGNKFSINGICYSFNEFICNNIPFHVARRTENKSYFLIERNILRLVSILNETEYFFHYHIR